MENKDKYLRIVLLDSIKVSAYLNKDKTKPTQPDFKGSGVAVWVNDPKDFEPKPFKDADKTEVKETNAQVP